MKVDLHIHTCFSDGGEDLQTIFDKLKMQNVEVCSITDHNNIDAYKTIEKVDKYNIKVVLGMEVDVEFENNFYHILMYGFDKTNTQLVSYLDKSRQEDINEFNRMIADLKSLKNIEFDSKKIEEFISKNQYFDKVRLNNFLVENGFAKTPVDVFMDFTKDIADKKRMVISASEFFELAKSCGATTSLAHPIKYLKNLQTMEELKKVALNFRQLGLDGIEVYNNRQTLDEQQELLDFAKQNGFVITGGSDYHAKIGAKESKILGECLGEKLTTEKLTITKKCR